MNAFTATSAIDYLHDNGVATLHAKPQTQNGPIVFTFMPAATHPGASYYETFAAAATLSQNGQILATFKAVAIDTMHTIYDDQEGIKTLCQLPQLSTHDDLGKAFGLFYLACWKLSWDAMEPLIPAKNNFKCGYSLNSMGFMSILHSGYLDEVEKQFFYQSQPNYNLREMILGEVASRTPSLCHPYGIHAMCSLFTGMGYQSNLEEYQQELNLPYTHYHDVVNKVTCLTALYWAARNHDPRLKNWRL